MQFSRYQHLLQQYIEVCNKALSQNQDKFPYNHLFKALNHVRPVTFILVDDAPKGLFELRVESAAIHARDMNGQPPTSQAIRMNISTLEEVLQSPEEYINDPSKIDWSWVRS